MKKSLILLSTILLISCGKTEVEKEIDEYDLKTQKLLYIKELMYIKEDIQYKERIRIIDSIIKSEKQKENIK